MLSQVLADGRVVVGARDRIDGEKRRRQDRDEQQNDKERNDDFFQGYSAISTAV